MSYRTPSRYDLPADAIKRTLAKACEVAASWRDSASLAVVEASLFGPFWGPWLRAIAAKLISRRLRVLAPQFDPAFYVRQFKNRRRPTVMRAPLLHYALIGWRENRSPAPGFDPIFYLQANPSLGKASDPLLHYVTVGAANSAARIDSEGSRPWRNGRDAVLTIHHPRGGGSNQFLDIFEEDLWRKESNVLRLRAVIGAPTLGVIEDRAERHGNAHPSETFDLSTDRARLAAFCQRRDVKRLLVSHLVDRPAEMTKWITELSQRLGCPYDVILHDYYAFCPRLNLVNGQGRFCGVAPVEVCVSCIERDGSDVGNVDPLTFRRDNLAFLWQAGTVFVPSQDVALRMSPYLPHNLQVWSPENDDALPPERQPCLPPDAVLDVGIIGGLNVAKGLHVVASLARAARLSNAPLRFTLVGPASSRALLVKEGVKVMGPYAPEDADRLIDEAAPQVVFLPAIWPETWSFVLTIALRRGLPVVAFDIGAPAERLRRLGRGRLLDLELAERPDALLAAFLELRSRWLRK